MTGRLRIEVVDVAVEPFAVAPALLARLRIEDPDGDRPGDGDGPGGDAVLAVALKCQVRIEPQRRAYSAAEQAGLSDLFGSRDRWSATLRPFLWMQASTLVPGFSGVTEAGLPLPVTYDFEVAGSKYLHAVRDGEVALAFLFSGTVLRRGRSGFEVSQIPWDTDVEYRLPVGVWHAVIEEHFPGTGWLRMPRATIQALTEFRTARGLTSWDETITTLLDRAAAGEDRAAAGEDRVIRP